VHSCAVPETQARDSLAVARSNERKGGRVLPDAHPGRPAQPEQSEPALQGPSRPPPALPQASKTDKTDRPHSPEGEMADGSVIYTQPAKI
jgi:hypothetical protein